MTTNFFYEGKSDFSTELTHPLLFPYASQCPPLDDPHAARTTVNINPISVKANTFFIIL